ncbi:MAG: alkaline phosphatase D family protein [Verrucomicrobiales bacterium]|nr:alkaline phosphatase D family protein [Verrucomicrobiales bacterium]
MFSGACAEERGSEEVTFPPHSAPLPEKVTRIAFGSCANQKRSHPIWEPIIETSPDLFLFLGDNVYADTEDIGEFREAYRLLGEKTGYQKLIEKTPVLAVWDDHDYGVNDGGADYPEREMAEQVFHEFFGTPADAAVRQYPGTYDVKYFGGKGERLQIILLDTRYFRGPLVELPERSPQGPYDRNNDLSATVLGEAQWSWLEKTLTEPADVRIIMSSIQFLPQDHRWERWENLPHERKRFLEFLKSAQTGPVLFLSGDRHMGEIMELAVSDPLSPGFPVYEVTSSGLTNAGGGRKGEPNRHRVSPINFQSRNFGLVTIDWPNRSLLLELRDVKGEVVDTFDAQL